MAYLGTGDEGCFVRLLHPGSSLIKSEMCSAADEISRIPQAAPAHKLRLEREAKADATEDREEKADRSADVTEWQTAYCFHLLHMQYATPGGQLQLPCEEAYATCTKR